MAMMNFIHSQIIIEKANSGFKEFLFEVQIPEKFSGKLQIFARIDVGIGDVYQITFHYYPQHVLH